MLWSNCNRFSKLIGKNIYFSCFKTCINVCCNAKTSQGKCGEVGNRNHSLVMNLKVDSCWDIGIGHLKINILQYSKLLHPFLMLHIVRGLLVDFLLLSNLYIFTKKIRSVIVFKIKKIYIKNCYCRVFHRI